ncbi:MAG: MFS transporter [Desulfobacteraceae bacterium]|jgi:MFS family permease
MSFKSLSSDGFYGWTNVIVASIFMFTITLMLQTFSLFLPEWINEYGWKYRDVSFALTINMIVMAFVTPFSGFFIGKYGSRICIIVGSAITIIAIYLLANVNSLWHLYLVNGVVVATGISLGGVLAITTLLNNWFSKKRSLALSVSMMAMGVAGIIMVPVVTWAIGQIGWRSTYITIIPVYFIFALLVPGIFLRNTPQELGQVPDNQIPLKPVNNNSEMTKDTGISVGYRTAVDFTVGEAFKTRTMWFLMIFNILNWFTVGAIMAHGYSFLNDLGIPRTEAGLFIGLISLVMVLGQMFIGFAGLKYSLRNLVLIGCTASIISYILMVFADTSRIIVYTYAIFAGMGAGINAVAMMNLIPNYFGVSNFPRISGITSPVGTLIGSAGAPICGQIRDMTGSYFPFWKIASILMTIGLLCLFFVKPPKHPSLNK